MNNPGANHPGRSGSTPEQSSQNEVKAENGTQTSFDPAAAKATATGPLPTAANNPDGSAGENLGKESGNNSGDSLRDNPDGSAGENFGKESGNNSGNSLRDNPDGSAGENFDKESGNNSGNSTGDNPGDNPGDNLGDNLGDNFDNSLGDTSGGGSGDNSGDKQPDPEAALKKEIEKVQDEAKDWKHRYLLAIADYDNLRKRSAKEVLEASSRGKENLVKVLLPVLDTFHSALRQMVESKVDKKVMEGMEMLWFQFSDTLEKEGLKPIPAMHQKFNPDEHEAMMRSSNPELGDEIIVREFETGYKFKDRVIRTAKVEINQK